MSSPTSYRQPHDLHWTEHVSLDLFLRALHKTFLHPFIAWLIPLCLRAQATPYSHPAFITTVAYASLLSLVVLLAMVNRRIAYGLPRTVDLEEEVVVITGGASGVGLLIAKIYGMRGVSVAVLDEKTPDREGKDGLGFEEMPSVEYYRCNVGDEAQVEEVARRINNDLGTPTILINCVAASINGLPLLSLSSNAIQKTINANLSSFFHTLQAFLPGMQESPNGGTIVTVSSVLAYLTAAGLSDYTATKAAITAVHKTVEAELALSGANVKVKMLLVETGQIATQLFERIKTPNKVFAPVLEPVQVAQKIVSVIDSGNGGLIRMPAYASLVSWYTVLPASIQKLARCLSGIDKAVQKAGYSADEKKEALKLS
ncbi:hypothetical protein LOZ61_003650 [Ophidiomyces ophidiicola]|uniref:uncharacterized protein n=1 Tax=Ophidiomyces ophidiicola TaxID=1387563 RepID=UPI0020C27505|nr:uncharacterized protein LOZ57_006039 [Ophidiomyces ophidiicola]KAI1911778.1 hypothetical protein LOZ61_003650 [Ophidiomyces ophidiicola]KAI1928442.1 hypothetical protein LOZ60_002394 [Ophidiomyces ophidiicola]KAI1939756.1 hypothetical protein LOZ57_006039 [Ophidiomyces ophidiicola]KAI2055337.1 hypothetical protein LOZ43_003787 [Ophidiomyces ophidiicola]KAI2141147.1 hypothetical protein LOZ27_004636 [Ophidiomyces ophidiicola]